MSCTVLILRPQPGADATAGRAKELGLEPSIYSLFATEPLAWTAPDPAGFDAVLLTSANTLRHGGIGLAAFHTLPAYAVGEATAQAARESGFGHVIVAGPDGQSTADRISRDGHTSIFHPGGMVVKQLGTGTLTIHRCPVYRTIPCGDSLELSARIAARPLILVHSARAGERLATLVPHDTRARLGFVAISDATRTACGTGWAATATAKSPDDPAMLAMAIHLCHKGSVSQSATGPESQD